MIHIVNLKTYKGECEYCGRPSILGNPYSHKDKSIAKYKCNSIEEAIYKHKNYLAYKIRNRDHVTLTELVRLRNIHDKKGLLILGCWCVPFTQCHCEYIKECILNLTDLEIKEFTKEKEDNEITLSSLFD